MKPIELKVSGLNSIIEEQTIEFDKLSEKGLFGIFGPTGSGKSTILDAITLALYGDIPRKNSDFINTNCDSLQVGFVFEIGNGRDRKKYSVERRIQRAKDGSIKTKYARLIEKGEEDKIIGDKPTTCKSEIKTIIGLNSQDFTRSVVLPQGKFSEFLNIQGKSKRDMLERIFALYKYGNDLTKKIRKKRDEENANKQHLLGSLSRYEGISESFYKEKKNLLKEEQIKEEELKIEKNNLDENYEIFKNIYLLQKELEEYIKKDKKLKLQQEEIEGKRFIYTKGKDSIQVKPLVKELDITVNKITLNNQELKELLKEEKEVKYNLSKLQEKFIKVSKEKEEFIPKLLKQETKLNHAIELKKQSEELKLQTEKLREDYRVEKSNGQKLQKDKIFIENEKINTEKNIKVHENKIEKLNMVVKERIKVNEGNQLQNKKNDLTRNIDKMKKNLGVKEEEISRSKIILDKLELNIDIINKIIIKNEEIKQELLENFPGNSDMLVKEWKELTEEKNIYAELLRLKERKELLRADKAKIVEELGKNNKELSDIINQIDTLRKNEKKKEDEIYEFEKERIAYSLSSKLEEGEPCPVCGNLHHIRYAENVDDSQYLVCKEELKILKESIFEKEEKRKDIQVKIVFNNSKIKELDNELKTFKNYDLENLNKKEIEINNKEKALNKLSESIETWNKNKEVIESLIESKKEEFNRLTVEKTKNEQQKLGYEDYYLKIKKDLEENIAEYVFTKEKLKMLQEELKIDDFMMQREKVIEADENIFKSQKEIREYRNKLTELQERIDSINNAIVICEKNKSKLEEVGKEKSSNYDKLLEQIKLIVKNDNPLELLKKVELDIKNINGRYNNVFTTLEEMRTSVELLSKNIATKNENKKNLDEIKMLQEEKFKEALLLYNFEDREEVDKFYLEKEVIIKLEKEITKYDDEAKENSINITRLRNKLNDKRISEEEWKELKEKKELLEKKLNELIRNIAKKEKEINTMKKDLDELKKLNVALRKVEHKLSLLLEIESLVKGNKFVEYIASNQLKYIARDASKRLKDITNGRYAIELNADGDFMIRDDNNGGALRQTASLSGGETFLTSLSLALALSSQIQLKGNAPLEFFFLDEGFGTLDSVLLDVVMTSLEKLHNENMAVGIISHVEELKNRVPVKLVVTPAKPGEGGSNVKLEYS